MTMLRALMKERSLTPRRVVSKLRRVARRAPERAAPATAWDRLLEPVGPVARTDPPGPTVVLLNDCRDQINFGSQALVDGLLAILFRSMPNATILPIPGHWVNDTSHWLASFVNEGVGMRTPRATYPSVADQFETIADEWMEGRGGSGAQQFLSRFEGADLVVLNGEGSIYRTNESAIRELFLAWLCKVRLEIPTVFVNGGLHLTDVVPILPAMVRKTFRSLDAVAVREPCSLRNLQEYVPGVDAQLFPDAAFVLRPDDARGSDVVKMLREHIGGSPYFCFDPGAMPIDARGGEKSAMHQMISVLKRVTPRAVFVANMHTDRYIEEIAHDTDSLYVDTMASYREFMALVSDAQFLVSGRYHNVILAAIMGCPSIALGSSSHKVHGACEMLDNLVGSPYDGTDLLSNLDTITQHAGTYVQSRAEFADQLQDVCGRRRAEAFGLGELVTNLVRTRA
jgi:polysaccharide pyruvyl transferase WcaK-like protein